MKMAPIDVVVINDITYYHYPITPHRSYTPPHAEFVKQDEAFKQACSNMGIPSTKRQASKFRRGVGLAYKSRGKM